MPHVLSETTARVGMPRLVEWYGLLLLTLIMGFNYADRFLLAILVQPIKTELGVSDSQIGLLTGFAFSAIYAVCAIPLGTLSDRHPRKLVLAASLAVWSVAAACCGLAQNFWQLLVARIGVGAGEAGGVPASHSMIADLFPAMRRSTAMAVYSVGASGGMMAAFALGGWLEQSFGWRAAFATVGLPGVFVALLLLLTFREPPRGRYAEVLRTSSSAHKSTVGELWANPAFRPLFFAFGLSVFLLYAHGQWLPAFFQRSFGGGTSELGAMIAATRGVGTLLGTLAGGLLADRMAKRNPLWPMRIVLWGTVIGFVPQAGMYLAHDLDLAYVLSGVSGLLGSLYTAPITATVQTIVRPSSRATASAMVMFSAAFIGMGGGPMAIGLASDALAGATGTESLRWALFGATVIATPLLLLTYMQVLRGMKKLLLDGSDHA
jgi:predicted MFS family arabinose efflux permease